MDGYENIEVFEVYLNHNNSFFEVKNTECSILLLTLSKC